MQVLQSIEKAVAARVSDAEILADELDRLNQLIRQAINGDNTS